MGIALSPDGGSVWFAEILGNKIGKVDTASAKITAEYSLPEQSGPTFLDFDDSGALWVSLSYSRSVMRIEPWLLASSSAAGMPILSLPKPDSFSPFGIAVANNGKLYLSDHGSSRVIVSDATLQNYTSYWTSPSGSFPTTLPSQIVSDDKSGNVYFPEHGGNRIARIDSQGVMTEYEIPTGPLSAAVFAAVSHDGKKVWFTEWASNKVAYLDASAQVPFDAQILQPQQSITLTKSGTASLDVLIKKSAIANGSSLGSLSLSQVEVGLTGMTESGLAGVTYHANPPRVNLQENASSSSAESNIQLQAQNNSKPGNYTAMVKVQTPEKDDDGLIVSRLYPVKLVLDVPQPAPAQTEEEQPQSSSNNIPASSPFDIRDIIRVLAAAAAVGLVGYIVYTKIKGRKKK
jgi:streptogramin lyase